jgi:hypothetical protein
MRLVIGFSILLLIVFYAHAAITLPDGHALYGDGDTVPAMLTVPIPPAAIEMPAQREDGTTLAMNELKGANVYYGTLVNDCSSSYTKTLFVPMPVPPQIQIPDVKFGTYCAVITAVDTAGRESLFHDLGQFTVTAPPKSPTVIGAMQSTLR